MTNKKEIREKQQELARYKEERTETTTPLVLDLVDQRIGECQRELEEMERAYNGDAVESQKEEQTLLFKSDYVLIVMEKAKENLKEALQDIAEGKYAQFSEGGIRQFKSNVERDLADADTALSLLKQFAPKEEKTGNEKD